MFTLASGGINSTFMTQGMGPKPMENAKIKTIKLTRGNQLKLFTVVSETKTEAATVDAEELKASNAVDDV